MGKGTESELLLKSAVIRCPLPQTPIPCEPTLKRKSVTYVSGTKCYLCLGPLSLEMAQLTRDFGTRLPLRLRLFGRLEVAKCAFQRRQLFCGFHTFSELNRSQSSPQAVTDSDRSQPAHAGSVGVSAVCDH